MIRRVIIAAALAATAVPAQAATKADVMKWELGYQVLNIADVAATAICLHQPTCEETNPIFGKHPKVWKLVAAKVVFGGLHYVLIDKLADKDTKTALRIAQVSVLLQGTVVGLNIRATFR